MATSKKTEELSSSGSSTQTSLAYRLDQPMTGTPKGYPVEILTNSSSVTHILCGICKLILKYPVQSTCGHRFCNDCINYSIRQTEVERLVCPSCIAEDMVDDTSNITKETIFPDSGVRKEMAVLKIKCSFENCSWSGNFKQFEEHYQSLHGEVLCPFGCDTKLTKATVDQHLIDNFCEHLTSTNSRLITLESTIRSNQGTAGGANALISQIELIESELRNVKEEFKRRRGLNSTGVDKQRPATDASKAQMDNQLNLPEQLQVIESVLTILSREADTLTQKMEMIEGSGRIKQQTRESVVKRVEIVEKGQDKLQSSVNELARRISTLEEYTYDGTLMWKIDKVAARRREAISGQKPSILSPVFCTSQYGYRLAGRVYLNGDGIGHSTHLSLYLVIVKGLYDTLQKWPFRRKVTMTLVSQANPRLSKQDFLTPDSTSSSFQRPITEMNTASGFPKFVLLSELDSAKNEYVKNDVMFIKISVDTTTD